VTFWCNDTSYKSPATLKVKVTSGQVKIPKPETITVNYVNGKGATSTPVTIDLSGNAPWQDLTITPTLPAGETRLIINPIQLTFTAAVKQASFTYTVSHAATGNFNTNVSFVISGTNGGSYAMAGTGLQTVKAVGTKKL